MDVDSNDERMVERSGQSSLLLAKLGLELICCYVYIVGSHALLQETSTRAISE